MKCPLLILTALTVSCVSAAEPQPRTIPAGYRVRTIELPRDVNFGVAGLAVSASGDVFAGTRFGDVWRYHNGRWNLFADGLHEIAGIRIDRASGEILVSQKPELTRLVDADNDGDADLYDTVCDDWGFTGNYHEFAFGPVRASNGDLFGTLNLSHGPGASVGGSIMTVGAPGRGTCYRVTGDGRYSTFAWGLRSPAGIGIHPETDDLFYTDNQGDWNASSSLQHIVKGSFHGHPASLKFHEDFAGRNLNEVQLAEYNAMRRPPAVWIPHGELANSPGNPEFDITAGKFGPFAGQIFVGDQTRSNVFRCVLDRVDGEYQGACVEFINHLQSGTVRLAFAPDGSLWAGQTSRGWGSVGSVPYGVQQIVYDQQTVPFEVHTMKVTPHGFDVTLTRPASEDVDLTACIKDFRYWGYHYHAKYGSEKVDDTLVEDAQITLSEDRRTLHVVPSDLTTGKVYRLRFSEQLTADNGTALANRVVWYTLNRLDPDHPSNL